MKSGQINHNGTSEGMNRGCNILVGIEFLKALRGEHTTDIGEEANRSTNKSLIATEGVRNDEEFLDSK